MGNNICKECGTENEPEYFYCKNCGVFLNAKAQTESPKGFNQNQSVNNKNFMCDSISGVSSEEVSYFVGKKTPSILPKFSKMEITGSKISWCWPPAVLGFLFGPLGASLWFFYRKMYKPAFLLSVIGTVLTLITSFLVLPISGSIEANLDIYLNGTMLDISGITDILSNFSPTEIIYYYLGNSIENLASILSSILCGLFGFHFYKKHCIKKINYFKSTQADSRFYRLGLSSIGGVSGGMLTLGIIIYLLSNYFVSLFLTITNLFT